MQKMNTRDLGRFGEDSAALYLTEHGYHIIGKNVYIGHEEIDIIAENDLYIAFVEVKTRRQTPDTPSVYGTPAEAVDQSKQRHLINAAKTYILENPTEKFSRIDVIEVYANPNAGEYKVLEIRHFENAVKNKGKFSRKSGYIK